MNIMKNIKNFIVKIRLKKEISKYDDNEKMIYKKDKYGIENWYEYDESGNMIHHKDNNDEEEWYDGYDESGNATHYKSTSGIEWWYEEKYDNGIRHINKKDTNIIYIDETNELLITSNMEYRKWLKFDKNGNLIRLIDNKGRDVAWVYDSNNKVTSCTDLSFGRYMIGYYDKYSMLCGIDSGSLYADD